MLQGLSHPLWDAFDDGSSITARFDDTTDAHGSVVGKYAVIGGAGHYDGVKGAGWYEKAEAPWENASLWIGGFELTVR